MIRAKTPSGGIASAATDSTFPTALCELYHVIDNGTTVTHIRLMNGSIPLKVRVCNKAKSGSIPGNTFIGISRMAGGAFAATWQDCG